MFSEENKRVRVRVLSSQKAAAESLLRTLVTAATDAGCHRKPEDIASELKKEVGVTDRRGQILNRDPASAMKGILAAQFKSDYAHYIDADEYERVVVPLVHSVIASKGSNLPESETRKVWKYCVQYFTHSSQVQRGLSGRASRRKSVTPGLGNTTQADRLLPTRKTDPRPGPPRPISTDPASARSVTLEHMISGVP